MKIVIELNNIDNLESYINLGVNTFIIGLKDFSISTFELSLEEIKKVVVKYPNIELFINMNKNIFNKEILKLEENLIELDKMRIAGILFYDLSILQLKKKNNLDIDLVWNQTHMVTNYNTCNYYYEKDVKYGIISSEITIDEMIEINNNSKMKFMTLLFGHPIMSHSKRNLLTNYYQSNNKKYDKQTHEIFENNKKYLIRENETGTSIIYGNIINGSSILKKLLDNKFDYVIIKEEYIDTSIIIKLIELTLNYMKTNEKEILDKINNLIGEDTNFFYKETIYKVKKNV